MLYDGDIINSSVMCRRDLYEKMKEECQWYIERGRFFDSVWSYWFSLRSSIFCMNENVTLYRRRTESDCHSQDKEKRYKLDKRYTMIKIHFLTSNGLDPALVLDVLSKEYDALYSYASWLGETKVRGSMAYKLGRKLLSSIYFLRLKQSAD